MTPAMEETFTKTASPRYSMSGTIAVDHIRRGPWTLVSNWSFMSSTDISSTGPQTSELAVVDENIDVTGLGDGRLDRGIVSHTSCGIFSGPSRKLALASPRALRLFAGLRTVARTR